MNTIATHGPFAHDKVHIGAQKHCKTIKKELFSVEQGWEIVSIEIFAFNPLENSSKEIRSLLHG